MYRKIIFVLLLGCFAWLALNIQKSQRKTSHHLLMQSSSAGDTGKANFLNRQSELKAAVSSQQPVKSMSDTLRIVPTGSIAGHDYVDLGLNVKWATCNVGAMSPSDHGNYYAWCETSSKSEYTKENSVTYKKNFKDNLAGKSRYDAARANWGGSWRLPTKAEVEELLNNCRTRWCTYNGHEGLFVTGPNGKSIFLPAAGLCYGSSLYNEGETGYYWSSAPYESGAESAYYLNFDHDGFSMGWGRCYYGRTVRPVSE